MNRRQALNYLNRLARAGEFTPAKPLREYKTETLQRKASTFKAQKKAGQPVNNAVARGHAATPEHPGRQAPQHPTPRPPRPTKGIPREVRVGDNLIRTTESARVADRVIRRAARAGERVVIKVHDENGWHTLGENTGHNKGISADYVRDQIKDAGGDIKAGIQNALNGGGGGSSASGGAAGGEKSSDDEVDWDDIDAWQIELLDWYDEDPDMDEGDYEDALAYSGYGEE